MSRPHFNFSKASATTSTTNATTISNSSFTKSGRVADLERASSQTPPTAFLLSARSIDSSPKIGAGSITPAEVSLSTSATGKVDTNADKHELLGIFEKYDVSAVDTDVDLLEEKMKQFKVRQSLSTEVEKDLADTELASAAPGPDLSEKQAVDLQTNNETIDEPETEPAVLEGPASPHSTAEALNKEDLDLEKPTHQAEEKTTNGSNNASVESNAPELNAPELNAPEPETSQNVESESLSLEDNDSKGDTEISTEISEKIFVAVSGSRELPELTDVKDSSIPSPKPSSMSMQPYDPFLPISLPTVGDNLVEEPAIEIRSRAPKLTESTRPKRQGSLSRASSYVDPKEQHQLSHKPFDFNTFLNHLKQKGAEPIVKYTKSFLASFIRQANNMNSEQMIKAVLDFKAFINEKFKEFPPFNSMDEKDLENSKEGIEKLIMNRIYDYCFSPEAVKKFGRNASASMIDDVNEDRNFALQVEKFSWVLGVHLDVDLDLLVSHKKNLSKGSVDYMEHARSQLNMINQYRAPRDKIICVLNSCKVIFSLLKVSQSETNADAFIPLLILVILKAKTPNFISNIRYILRFRGELWLTHGETSYYLSTIEAAVNFIQDIKLEDLTIEESHYNAHMEAWEAEIRQNKSHLAQPIPQHTNNTETPTAQSMSPSNVILASAGILGKSLTNFLSLSPLNDEVQPAASETGGVSDTQIDETFTQLSEVFNTLDKAILRDVIIMNDGDVERSLEACLQLVSEQ